MAAFVHRDTRRARMQSNPQRPPLTLASFLRERAEWVGGKWGVGRMGPHTNPYQSQFISFLLSFSLVWYGVDFRIRM